MAVVTLRFKLNLHMVKGVILCQVWLIWKIGGSGNGQYDFNGQNNYKLLTDVEKGERNMQMAGSNRRCALRMTGVKGEGKCHPFLDSYYLAFNLPHGKCQPEKKWTKHKMARSRRTHRDAVIAIPLFPTPRVERVSMATRCTR